MTVPLQIRGWGTQDLYASALAGAVRGQRLYDPGYADAMDADIYEKVRRDCVITHAIDQLLMAVSGRKYRVVPGRKKPTEADKRAAAVAEGALGHIRKFMQARYMLAEAAILGRSFAFIGTETMDDYSIDGEDKPRKWTVPRTLNDIDRRRFRLMTNWEKAGRDYGVRWEMSSTIDQQWYPIRAGDPILIHVYTDAECRLGYGRGMLDSIAFWHRAVENLWNYILSGAEKWSEGGILHYQYDPERNRDLGQDNVTVRTAIIDQLQKARGRHVFVGPVGDVLTQIPLGGQGVAWTLEIIRDLYHGMTQMILGAVLPTGGSSRGQGGSYARAETEAASTQTREQYCSASLFEDLSEQLINPFWRWNWANIVDMGLAKAAIPVAVPDEEASLPLADMLAIIDKGIEMKQEEFYRRAGISIPEKGDETVGAPPPEAQPQGAKPEKRDGKAQAASA